jgi:hypothetical protein
MLSVIRACPDYDSTPRLALLHSVSAIQHLQQICIAFMMGSLRDPNTLSNYDKFITSHITAKLDIDFDKNQLSGNVILNLKSLGDDGTKVIKLDTR